MNNYKKRKASAANVAEKATANDGDEFLHVDFIDLAGGGMLFVMHPPSVPSRNGINDQGATQPESVK